MSFASHDTSKRPPTATQLEAGGASATLQIAPTDCLLAEHLAMHTPCLKQTPQQPPPVLTPTHTTHKHKTQSDNNNTSSPPVVCRPPVFPARPQEAPHTRASAPPLHCPAAQGATSGCPLCCDSGCACQALFVRWCEMCDGQMCENEQNE